MFRLSRTPHSVFRLYPGDGARSGMHLFRPRFAAGGKGSSLRPIPSAECHSEARSAEESLSASFGLYAGPQNRSRRDSLTSLGIPPSWKKTKFFMNKPVNSAHNFCKICQSPQADQGADVFVPPRKSPPEHPRKKLPQSLR